MAENFVVYMEVNGREEKKTFGRKAFLVGGAIAVAMLLAVALSGNDEGSGLAQKMAAMKTANTQRVKNMERTYSRREILLRTIHEAVSSLPAKAQVLAKSIARRIQNHQTLAAFRSTKLQQADCARKDTYLTIQEKFNSLKANLTSEKAERMKLDEETKKDKDQAYQQWIESESAFRSAQTTRGSAVSAAEYAKGELEKYSSALKEAQENFLKENAPIKAEKENLAAQQQMITNIVGLIQSMTSSAAKGTSNDVKLKQVEDSVAKLAQDSLSLPAQARAQLQKLQKATTSLSDVTAATIADSLAILNEMSTEISGRIEAIDAQMSSAEQEIANNKAKKEEWMVKLVELSDTADKAKADENSADLTRQQLGGQYEVKKSTYDDQSSSLDSDLQQYDKEISAVGSVVQFVDNLVAACSS